MHAGGAYNTVGLSYAWPVTRRERRRAQTHSPLRARRHGSFKMQIRPLDGRPFSANRRPTSTRGSGAGLR